jgi:hypothetical protein
MRLHSLWAVAFFASLVLSTSASGQDKNAEIKYKFHKGDVLKYEVRSTLECSQVGTNAAFLMMGNDKPLTWVVNGMFENAVLDVNEADGTAQLERRVKSIDSSGHVQGPSADEQFKFSWNRDKDKSEPDESKLTSMMDRFIANMVVNKLKYSVDVDGKTSPPFPELGNLVMKRGMMFWPIKASEMSWVSTEVIALPILHDKIKLEFKNSVTQDATRTGFKARMISATAALKSSERTPGFGYDNLEIKISGGAKAEFDMTNGRLSKLELDLTITFSGKAQIPEGGEGDIKGVATYKETQVYKD